jgi:predicted DNA-binding transcriptional regulator AlpA
MSSDPKASTSPVARSPFQEHAASIKHPGGDLIHQWAGISAEVGKSRVQIWRDIRAGLFPAPIAVGPNRLAWFRAEVEEWKANCPRRRYTADPPPKAA